MYFSDMHTPQNAQNVWTMDQFFSDVSNNQLPQFVFLQPSMNAHEDHAATWQHPTASLTEGEMFLKVCDGSIIVMKGVEWRGTR
jgi:hypothetical protein